MPIGYSVGKLPQKKKHCLKRILVFMKIPWNQRNFWVPQTALPFWKILFAVKTFEYTQLDEFINLHIKSKLKCPVIKGEMSLSRLDSSCVGDLTQFYSSTNNVCVWQKPPPEHWNSFEQSISLDFSDISICQTRWE